jgi:hypothetical protein
MLSGLMSSSVRLSEMVGILKQCIMSDAVVGDSCLPVDDVEVESAVDIEATQVLMLLFATGLLFLDYIEVG